MDVTCPQCDGQNVKPLVSYPISHDKQEGPPMSMWACKNPTCLHKWPQSLAPFAARVPAFGLPDKLRHD